MLSLPVPQPSPCWVPSSQRNTVQPPSICLHPSILHQAHLSGALGAAMALTCPVGRTLLSSLCAPVVQHLIWTARAPWVLASAASGWL